MAEIVNLRAARKAKDRLKKRAQGSENAVKFGRTKAERELEKARADKARALLDGHEREAPEACGDD
ncbi:DUF4169 family protein [Ostreiculturibacter nitratireducens]|uniref:DUF4169 family protein n=1 Tax=Ostreiculturibacter nitratireducens TaxID=3075226 RepID=UPI0031B5BEB6